MYKRYSRRLPPPYPVCVCGHGELWHANHTGTCQFKIGPCRCKHYRRKK